MKLGKEITADLGKLAVLVRNNAYAPYSNHPVGAVIVTASGNVYAGANCETVNFDSTCAEHSAIAAMVTGGDRVIRHIAVAGPGKQLITPCGRCRQRIFEFSDAKTRVLLFNNAGKLMKTLTMAQLLPRAFGPRSLMSKKKGK